MAKSLLLLKGQISLVEALARDDNIHFQLSLVQKRADFFATLSDSTQDIEATVANHLAVPRRNCTLVNDCKEWIHGSFNVCIPVLIKSPVDDLSRKVLVRIPLPYKVGEERNPGNGEEKLRSEVATYIWMQEHCPSVPIPRLLGFGFPTGASVSFSPDF